MKRKHVLLNLLFSATGHAKSGFCDFDEQLLVA